MFYFEKHLLISKRSLSYLDAATSFRNREAAERPLRLG